MTTNPIGDLERQVERFAQQWDDLLRAVLPHLPDTSVLTEYRAGMYLISAGENAQGVPLFIDRRRVATLMVRSACRLDSADRYLAIEYSAFSVRADVDRTPILRYEYRRDMDSAPTAHLHVHAHRGALSHLLSRSGHERPHDMSALHFPVGGSRFRPCLEDLLQFLIQECGFDSRPGWHAAVAAGREQWRLRQVAAVARDAPQEVARVLAAEYGYTTLPPPSLPDASEKMLRHW